MHVCTHLDINVRTFTHMYACTQTHCHPAFYDRCFMQQVDWSNSTSLILEMQGTVDVCNVLWADFVHIQETVVFVTYNKSITRRDLELSKDFFLKSKGCRDDWMLANEVHKKRSDVTGRQSA